MKSKLPVWIDWSWLAYSAPPSPAMPAEIANTAVLVATQAHAERRARGFAVAHREQPAAERAAADPHDEQA